MRRGIVIRVSVAFLLVAGLAVIDPAPAKSAPGDESAPGAVLPAPEERAPRIVARAPIAAASAYPGRLAIVMLDAKGALNGIVRTLPPNGRELVAVPNETVGFLRNGRVIAQARTGSNGRFAVNSLRPGRYSLLASGPHGFAAFLVVVEPFADNTAAKTKSSERKVYLTSTQPPPVEGDGPPSELLVDGLVPPGDANLAMEAIAPLTSPAPFGAPAGGSAGGGGGGGGGGLGLLGLAGLAGLAGLGQASPFVP